MPNLLLLVVVCFHKGVFCFSNLSLHAIYTGAGCNLQSLSAITTFISRLGLEHLSFIAWKKGVSTTSSSLLHMRWATVYPLLNSSGTTNQWKFVLVCFARCINTYYFMCLLFKHFQLFLCLKSKREYVVLQINIVVYFGPIIVFSPWPLRLKLY